MPRAERLVEGSGGGAQTELIEAQTELLDPAVENGGQDAKIVPADRQHLAVEVLALQLNRPRVPRQDRRIRVVDVAQASEVDRVTGVERKRRAPGLGQIYLRFGVTG